MNKLPYTKNSKESIEKYAFNLKEKTFKDVLLNDSSITEEEMEELLKKYNKPKSKASLGQLIEKHYFY